MLSDNITQYYSILYGTLFFISLGIFQEATQEEFALQIGMIIVVGCSRTARFERIGSVL